MTSATDPTGASLTTLHASCVAQKGRAVLITGKSGSGKSGLALRLMALGAQLVADDRTAVTRAGDRLIATCPAAIRGRIEARGVGILNAPVLDTAEIALVVDLDRRETARLPERHEVDILGLARPCLHDCDFAHFPAAILHYLAHGRHA